MMMVVYVVEQPQSSEFIISLKFRPKLIQKTEKIVIKQVFSNRHIIMKGFKCFQLNSKILVRVLLYLKDSQDELCRGSIIYFIENSL